MASGIIGGRGTSAAMRAVWRTTAQKRTAKKSATVTNPTRVSLSSSIRIQIRPQNFTFCHCPRFSPRLVRRELSSLVPLHSAIASACLVSNLPSDVNSSAEGRFVNYVSPI
ncbi:hypothetical protein K2173_020813 [Erythroxylum novogranatense]|uniref:Uncharacterized protein n=1 Tax=Erythroxylum novogranatense TaxID=1862640 RepID=A0AAV8TNV8_9ROSI|nr:hypothetical protein K2173_020813 [Erythroxylum novogranatense]